MLIFIIDNKQYNIIIEYDGFEFHFNNLDDVNEGNWESYLKETDIEREKILESYGYKTLRINRFNVGKDPISNLNFRIDTLLREFQEDGNGLTGDLVERTRDAVEGLASGEMRVCRKCNQNKPADQFIDPNSSTGNFKRYCKTCTPISRTKGQKKKKKSPTKPGFKICKNCRKSFPESEFIDRTNRSGRRLLCGSCKIISDRKREEESRRWHNRGRY